MKSDHQFTSRICTSWVRDSSPIGQQSQEKASSALSGLAADQREWESFLDSLPLGNQVEVVREREKWEKQNEEAGLCNKTGFREFLEATKKRLAGQKGEDANGFPPLLGPEFKAVGNPGIQVSSLSEFFSTPIMSTNNEDLIYYQAVSEQFNELSSVECEAIT